MTESHLDTIAQWDKNLKTPIDKKGRAFFVNPNQEGRRFAIGDIHGCFQTFVTLLERMKLTKKDQVFILGDMIDRGPYSVLVVEHIMSLMRKGYQFLPLRGNHEQLVIDMANLGKGNLRIFTDRQSAGHLAILDKGRFKDIIQFFKKLPLYYETPFEFLVHAGFESQAKHPLTRWDDMCWIRNFQYDKEKFGGKRIIHGHVPRAIGTIRKTIKTNGPTISLDNACAKSQARNFGKLVCLNLDSGDLISQKNIDVVPV